MSIKLMSQVWKKSDLAGTPLLLLLSLADYANDDGVCWPSIPNLAKRIRTSERQCQRLLADLIARQAIEIVDRSLGGRGYTSVYRVIQGTTNGDIQRVNGDISGTNGDISGSINGDIQRVNGDISGTNGDISGSINGDIQRVNGDIQRVNGDIAMSPDPPIDPPIDPPLTPPPTRGGGGGGGVPPQNIVASPGRRITDPAFGEVCNRYEQNFGLLGESLLRQIGELLEEFPQPLILAAMDTAIANEKRNLAYVRGVLRNNGNQQFSRKGNDNGERRSGAGKPKEVLSPSVERNPNADYDHEWAMQYIAEERAIAEVPPLPGHGLDSP